MHPVACQRHKSCASPVPHARVSVSVHLTAPPAFISNSFTYSRTCLYLESCNDQLRTSAHVPTCLATVLLMLYYTHACACTLYWVMPGLHVQSLVTKLGSRAVTPACTESQ